MPVRRSFLRLVVGSVLACWAIGSVVVVGYSRGHTWTLEKARRNGVLLAYELLDTLPADRRRERLHDLAQHFSVGLTLISSAETKRRAGRQVALGEKVPLRVSWREQWLLLAFNDGNGALAAGPVDPTSPKGFKPIGIFVAIVALPLIAGFIALRIDRRLRRVELASQALADGKLSARVDTDKGPPDELAASFNAMALRIESLIRSRDELLQAVSHELGSPLSRLRFHMELLESQPAEKQQERLAVVARDLDALDELVAELMSYVQSDDVKLDRRSFNPAQNLRDLAELAQLQAAEDGAISVELEVKDELSVYADARLFQRAVENILRNALRHARRRVLLQVEEDETQVKVSVHDDGEGIPAALRDKVTVPFYRLDQDRGRRTGGAGLGLAIVNRIMRRHSGELAIGTSDSLDGAMVSTCWPKLQIA